MNPTSSPPAVPLTPDTRLCRTEDWLSTLHDDAVIMMHAQSGRFVGLNETATRIWQLLETPRTLGELGASLAREYATTPEQAVADMTPLTLQLIENGAVAVATPAE